MTEAARDFAVGDHATEAGKELGIFKVAGTALYCVAFKSGGECPSELKGMWTEPRAAEAAIKGYLAKRAMEAEQKAAKPKPTRKPKKEKAEPPVDIFAESVEEEDGPSEAE